MKPFAEQIFFGILVELISVILAIMFNETKIRYRAIILAIGTLIAGFIAFAPNFPPSSPRKPTNTPSPITKTLPVNTATITPTSTAIPAFTLIPTSTKIPPGTVLLYEDFEDKQVQNFTHEGISYVWKFVTDEYGNTVYEVDNTNSVSYSGIVFGSPSWENYAIEYRVRFPSLNQDDQVLVDFRKTDDTNYTQAIFPYWSEVIFASGYPWKRIDTQHLQFASGTWYSVRIEIENSQIKIFIDNKLIISEIDTRLQKGIITFKVSPGTLAQFDDVHVTSLGE